MNLGDRLRSVVRPGRSAPPDPSELAPPGGSASRNPPYVPDLPGSASRNPLYGTHPGGSAAQDPPYVSPEQVSHSCAAEVLGGEWRESRGHRYVAVERRYPVGHRLGRVSVADCLPAEDGAWPRLSLLLGRSTAPVPNPGRTLFVDLETTGLAGGAGTRAFLVGLGWFDGASFRVRQLLLTGYVAERVLLEEVADLAARSGTLVTYNGKTFDVPLIETRFLFHRMPPPFSDVPHLDMLHQARRLWRPSATSESREHGYGGTQTTTCRLSAMEESVLGHVRENDVAGFEVPSRYFHYVRTGDARPLEAVFEHNRLDLLALAMLTATAATLLEEGPAASRTASEALGLGRVYERGGLTEEARACYARAAALGESCVVQGEALRAYGVSCRRAGQFDAAAEAWQRILALPGCPAHITKDAAEALAVHHEHRLRNFHAAREFAVHSLELTVSTTRREAARHRVARLDRKLGTRVVEPDPAPLFHSA